jgi:4-hydroxy-tetrahydrodipicolinate synthase
MFQGALTALITPFSGGRIDADRLREQVQFQIENGADGLCPVGTTGESPTLDHEEHNRVTSIVVEAADGRLPVIAGAGSNSTAEALRLTHHAADVGASATLQVVPYYNKPTQEGLYRHFMTLAEEVELPLILYNIPGRTGVTMSSRTIARLAEYSNIVAVKEATGSMDQASEIAQLTGLRDFAIFAGDDSLSLPLMSVGGSGVISVAANAIPGRIHELTERALGGDFETARRIHLQLFPLFRAMFLETNPIPIKTAMKLLGRDTGEMRLPLCDMAEDNLAALRETLQQQEMLA